MFKIIIFVLIWKNIKQLNFKYFNKIEYNFLKFQIKKNQVSHIYEYGTYKYFKKLLPWKKKTYKQQGFEEQIFFLRRRKQNFPFWMKKQFWFQQWYNFNHVHDIYLLREIKFKLFLLNIFKKKILYTVKIIDFYWFLYFYSNYFIIFFKSNVLMLHLNLFSSLINNITQTAYFFLFHKNKFYLWDKHKLINWKNFKWSIFFIKKISKNHIFFNECVFIYLKQGKLKNNIYLTKQKLINHLINLKKSNSSLKQSINLTKYAAHLNNFTTKYNQFNFSSSFFLKKYAEKIKSKDYQSKFFLFKKDEFSKYVKFSHTIKFIHLNTKWFKLYCENRKILKFFFSLKYKKQQFTTKFLMSFLKKTFLFLYQNIELNLINMLVKSRLALTYQHAKDLLFLGYIYINGWQVKNIFYLLKPSDHVQILISDNYLINYQYQYLNLKKKQKNIKYCFQRWYMHRFDFYKQHTKRFPSWILKLLFLKFDVPAYIELDYSILTFIVLRIPHWFFELNMYLYKYINLYFIRLYNWKYLT